MQVSLSGHYGYKRLLRTAVPSIVTMLFASIYSIVDGFFVSNFVGATAFSAINMASPFLMLIGSLGMMFGSGGSALVSKAMGRGHRKRANEIFSKIIREAAISGILFSVLMFILFPTIIDSCGAKGEFARLTVSYGRICLLGIPAFIITIAFQSLYMTAEKPTLGTMVTAISGIMNVGLDALFIIGFGWGVEGAAIATVTSHLAAMLFPLIYFSSDRNNSALQLTHSNISYGYILKACTNGLSEYVGNVSLSVVSICYNYQLIRLIGPDGVAAYGILLYIGFIFAAIFIGYNLTVNPIIGYNYGADDKVELRSLLRHSLIITGVIGTGLTILSECTSSLCARIFVGYDAELTALTTHAIRLYMISFMICGINMFVSTWFTGLNNGIVSAVAAFSRTLLFELGCVFILPELFGVDGIWVAVDFADLFALILSIGLLLGYRKRYGY
ncbi:MAG: MATE family efflux transporter [Paludibacteraceae bacterium]|nr:MATE family efflux transporter [Paludibacteraceae bacterium]